MSDITPNELTVKDSFTFVDEILSQDSGLDMVNLNVDSLFTNIILNETIDISSSKYHETLGNGIFKNDFMIYQIWLLR